MNLVYECTRCFKRVRDLPNCFQPFRWKCVKGGKHDFQRVAMIGSRGRDRFSKVLPVHTSEFEAVKSIVKR